MVEIRARVAQDNARAFHSVMRDVQLSRQPGGAYGWSIARHRDPGIVDRALSLPDLAGLFTPAQPRTTLSGYELHQQAIAFHLGPEPIRVRHMLERPFGSVRWKEDTPDRRHQRGVASGRDGRRGAAPG